MPAKGALSCLPTASQPWDRSQAAGHVSPVRGDIQHHPRRIDHRFKIQYSREEPQRADGPKFPPQSKFSEPAPPTVAQETRKQAFGGLRRQVAICPRHREMERLMRRYGETS
jgi:hypothetical protein